MDPLSHAPLLQWINNIVLRQAGAPLTDIQTYILQESLNQKRYSEMIGYDQQYLKNQGATLWQLLSNALNHPLNKRNCKAVLTQHYQSQPKQQYDWGESPGVPLFFGRQQELTTLEQWIIRDRCQLVAILGMKGIGKTRLSIKLGQGNDPTLGIGDRNHSPASSPDKLGKGGIGKTDLSIKLAQGIQHHFDFVIWRRLMNSPSLTRILTDCILFFSNHQDIDIPSTEAKQITRLLHYFKTYRCLVILDNLETVLKARENQSCYREGLEGYGTLLEKVGTLSHQSCLLLTSRETPPHLDPLEGRQKPVRFYHLQGLNLEAGKAIFQSTSTFQGSDTDWDQLIHYYNGNPLALELAAKHIEKAFQGNLTRFWTFQQPLFEKIKELLSWHFQRLSDHEHELVLHLAINRNAIALDTLHAEIISSAARAALPETLKSLQQKLPLESGKENHTYTLHPVLMEYATDWIVHHVYQEIISGDIHRLNQYYLLKAQAPDDIRDSQTKLILTPIIDRLKDHLYNLPQIENKLKQILSQWQQTYPHRPGYLAGNILNLLCLLEVDLTGYNFSKLVIWQADLQGRLLHQVNFSQCNLKTSTFTRAFAGIHAVAFSKDSNLLAVGDSQGKIRLMRATNAQTLSISEQAHPWFVISLDFNSENTRLVSSAMDSEVFLWAIADSQLTFHKKLTGHQDWVWHVQFSPDDRLIATASDDTTIRLWDADTGICIRTLTGHHGWVVSVAFHPHQPILASGSVDGTVKFWDLQSGDCLETLNADQQAVWSVIYHPNGKVFFTGGWDRSIKVWDAKTQTRISLLQGHQNPIKNMACSPDGTLLVSGAGITQAHCKPTLKIWDTASGRCLRTCYGHQSGIRSLTISPDQQTIVSGDIEQVVKFWDVKTGQSRKTLSGHTDWVWTLDFSPDGQCLASGGLDRLIRLWDMQTHSCMTELSGHGAWVWNVTFCKSGRYLATSSDDQTVRLWNYQARTATNCQKIFNESGQHQGGMWAMACSPDGQTIATSGQSSMIRLWDTSTGQLIREIGTHAPYWIWSLDFSPDGRWLASASDDRTIKIWHFPTGQLHLTLTGHTRKLRVIRFSPDGTVLVSAGEDTVVRIWDIETGQCLHQLLGHESWIWAIAISADCRFIASGGNDGLIRVWDIASLECRTIVGVHDYVTALVFHPDSQTIASGSMNGSIRLWNAITGHRLATLRSPRPYEDMNIQGVTGLTDSQISTLQTLGAVLNSE